MRGDARECEGMQGGLWAEAQSARSDCKSDASYDRSVSSITETSRFHVFHVKNEAISRKGASVSV